jgi:hypothetical protein
MKLLGRFFDQNDQPDGSAETTVPTVLKRSAKGERQLSFRSIGDNRATMATNKTKNSNKSSADTNNEKESTTTAESENETNSNNKTNPPPAIPEQPLTERPRQRRRPPPPRIEPVQLKTFSKPQLTFLILASMAISHIFQVDIARKEGSPMCVEYLGEDACKSDAIRELLRCKMTTAWHAVGVAAAAVLGVWKREEDLASTNTIFLIAPMSLGILVLFGSVIPRGLIYKEVLLCMVLGVLCLPKKTATPPIVYSKKTLPCTILAGLIIYHLHETYQLLVNHLLTSNPNENYIIVEDWTDLEDTVKKAAQPIVLFMGVDRITEILLLFWAFWRFSDSNQRSVLGFLAIIESIHYALTYSSTALGTIVLGMVGWIAPTVLITKTD